MSGKGKVKPNNQVAPGPIGNTQGLIVPQTSPNASGPGNSTPPPKPTPKEEGWWKRWGSDVTHGIIDVVGMIPVVGEPFNLAGAGIYALEGDYVSAAMDLAAMLPVGGQAATAGKYGVKGAKAAEKQVAKKLEGEAQGKVTSGVVKQEGGYVIADSKPKKRSKPRQPQTYEKKVINEDGSVTYTLKDKQGRPIDVTYKDGYPDFSPYKYDGSLGKGEVPINMTGNNRIDFERANQAAGFGDKAYSHPDGYIWHHHQDGKTMQLIEAGPHSAAPHTGGASLFKGGG